MRRGTLDGRTLKLNEPWFWQSDLALFLRIAALTYGFTELPVYADGSEREAPGTLREWKDIAFLALTVAFKNGASGQIAEACKAFAIAKGWKQVGPH